MIQSAEPTPDFYEVEPQIAVQDLAGCDLVLSIPEGIINDHLEDLYHDPSSPLPTELNHTLEGAQIQSKLQEPEVKLTATPEAAPTSWTHTLVLNFDRGIFALPSGKKFKTDGWKLGFFAQVLNEDIESHNHIDEMRIKAETKTKLKSFDPAIFRIKRLYVTMKNGPVFDYLNRSLTNFIDQLTDEELKTFCKVVESFLRAKMTSHTNPYHIGFVPTQKATGPQSTSHKVEYKPTGLKTSVSVAYDDKGTRTLVLNYLMMTENRPFPPGTLSLAPHRGTKGCFLRIAQKRFMDHLFLRHYPRTMKLREMKLKETAPKKSRWESEGPHAKQTQTGWHLSGWTFCDHDFYEFPRIKLHFEQKTSPQFGNHIECKVEVRLYRWCTVKFLAFGNETGRDVIESNVAFDMTYRIWASQDKLRYNFSGVPEHKPNVPKETWDKLRHYANTPWRNGWVPLSDRCEFHLATYKLLFQEHDYRSLASFREIAHNADLEIKVPTKGVFTLDPVSIVQNPSSKAWQLVIPVHFDGV